MGTDEFDMNPNGCRVTSSLQIYSCLKWLVCAVLCVVFGPAVSPLYFPCFFLYLYIYICMYVFCLLLVEVIFTPSGFGENWLPSRLPLRSERWEMSVLINLLNPWQRRQVETDLSQEPTEVAERPLTDAWLETFGWFPAQQKSRNVRAVSVATCYVLSDHIKPVWYEAEWTKRSAFNQSRTAFQIKNLFFFFFLQPLPYHPLPY